MRRKPLRILTCAVAFITLALLGNSCKKDMHTSNSPAGNEVSIPRAATYQLIWSDEFNGTSVNTSNWNIDNGNPNVNHELEYYQGANATVTVGARISCQSFDGKMLAVRQHMCRCNSDFLITGSWKANMSACLFYPEKYTIPIMAATIARM